MNYNFCLIDGNLSSEIISSDTVLVYFTVCNSFYSDEDDAT